MAVCLLKEAQKAGLGLVLKSYKSKYLTCFYREGNIAHNLSGAQFHYG